MTAILAFFAGIPGRLLLIGGAIVAGLVALASVFAMVRNGGKDAMRAAQAVDEARAADRMMRADPNPRPGDGGRALRNGTFAVLLALGLQGCAGEPAVVFRCPPLPEYAQTDQTAAADAYDALPPGSPLRVLVDDYGAVRKRCRALVQK